MSIIDNIDKFKKGMHVGVEHFSFDEDTNQSWSWVRHAKIVDVSLSGVAVMYLDDKSLQEVQWGQLKDPYQVTLQE